MELGSEKHLAYAIGASDRVPCCFYPHKGMEGRVSIAVKTDNEIRTPCVDRDDSAQ